MSSITLSDQREFLIEKILKNYSGIYDKPTTEKLQLIRKEKLLRPAIFIGTGTCGRISGAEKTLDAINTYVQKIGLEADVIEVGCLGLCSAEPLVEIQIPGKTRLAFRNVTEDKIESIINSVMLRQVASDDILGQHRNAGQEPWANLKYLDEHEYFSHQQRIILKNAGLISPWSIDDYLANGGYKSLYKTVLNYTADKVCEIIENSELRGRGGSGFPTGKKWQVALNTGSDQKYLICNADESDPGGYMNRAILENDPHRVIEGIAIAAYAIGAKNAYIHIRADYSLSIRIIENAVKEAKACGFTGENIFGSGFNLNIHIRQGAGAFVCGEETALIASLEGRRGTPMAKPPYPAEKGLFGHPTVVNNVETLANVPAILENGPSWFRSIGTRESRGTKVFSLAGKARMTGIIEIPMGMTILDIVNKIAGGVREDKKLKAIQLGGPSGVCIPLQDLSTPVGYESLRDIGSSLGLGGMLVLDEDVCMVNLSKYFIEFLHNESCGKCIPCREGTKRMLNILEDVTRRPREDHSHETLERFKGIMELETLAGVIRDTSLCGLGQNAPNPVLSSLKWFRDEYEEHIFDRKCQASVCHDLRTFVIDVDLCTGCNVCLRKCPENAIIGSPKMPHFIIEGKCTGCGICFDSCKFNAIFFK